MSDGDAYEPQMSLERAALLRRWHERTSNGLHALGPHDARYLGLDLTIPEHVFPPTPMSDLLGRAVLDEVREDDRVLDMGTGSGANAILAASRSRDVLGVDVNPHAVAAAATNAERNGVAGRTRFAVSDVFDTVDGTFDLIVFDPPFQSRRNGKRRSSSAIVPQPATTSEPNTTPSAVGGGSRQTSRRLIRGARRASAAVPP